ncbi:MAG: Fe-S cluster assembly protein SufD [Gemmatimonadaceae bacterium]|nr:Fe-S cluster assembly protein SufD [Gemmatimonadaceae bacterium]
MTMPYAEQFEAFATNGGAEGPAWLPALRERAFERFRTLGFPTTRDEDWHFTSVTPIAERTFKSVKPAATQLTLRDIQPHLVDADWHRLVFVNGQLEPSLSQFAGLPADVQLSPLSEVMRQDAKWLEQHLGTLAAFDKAAFTAMNTAFMQDGVVLRLPKGEVVDVPIHILHLTDGEAQGAAIHPRLLVVAEPLSNATLVESFVGLGGASYLVNAVAEIVVGDGARVDHYKLQREGAEAFHVGTVQVSQGRDSIYHSFSYAAGGALSRTNIYTKLLGTGSEARLNGLYVLDGSQHADHQTFVEHIAESCASRELYCGILDGQSHGVFNGKVFVDPQAQKTDGKQTNKALLLSPQARVDTKPQLEIFADDVKCTHGATVGRIDETALFYLKSRGIGSDNARALLTYAFAAEALETIEIDALRLTLERNVFERFTHTRLE